MTFARQSAFVLHHAINSPKHHTTGHHPKSLLPLRSGIVLLLPLLGLITNSLYNHSWNSPDVRLLLPASPTATDDSPAAAPQGRRGIMLKHNTFTTTTTTRKTTKTKTPYPHKDSKKTYWMYGTTKKSREPIARALRLAGWERTDDATLARIVWTDMVESPFFHKLQPWQRYSQIPNTTLWSSATTFTKYMLEYAMSSGTKMRRMPGIPETYRLETSDDLQRLEQRLAMKDASSVPWIVTHLMENKDINNTSSKKMTKRYEPNTIESLQHDIISQQDGGGPLLGRSVVVTRGVCGEWRTARRRTLDVRIYWLVASLDPLVVLYHDGFVRVQYSNKLDEFSYMSLKDFFQQSAVYEYANKYVASFITDPYLHIKSQVKQIIGTIAAAFRDVTFHARDISAENGFGLYAASLVVDQNLDVSISQLIPKPARDEDYDFRVRMHDVVFVNMFRVLERIADSEEQGLASNNESLDQKDGGFEVVYNDGWKFEYDKDWPVPTKTTKCDEYHDVEHVTFKAAPPRERYANWSKTRVAAANNSDNLGSYKTTTPCPSKNKKTFYMESSTLKLYEPVARAFRFNGWKRTRRYQDAQVIWTDQPENRWFKRQLQPWQRYSQIPRTYLWDSKHHFVTGMQDYKKKTGKELPAVPETYRLSIDEDVAQFQKRLADGGLDSPWVLKKPKVNKGKGVTMLGPNSDELKNVLETVKSDETEKNYIIQRYVCNEMTIDQHKFDFRIFWLVASLDPLIVLYHHDGYVRVGNAVYDETEFNNTSSHLTTHTFLSSESKKTWEEFKLYIVEAAKRNPRLKHIQDPFLHVTNQIKHVLAQLVDAYKDRTFHTRYLKSENGFALHAGDFVIDNDLDVTIIEGTDGPGKDEDYRFRIEMHDSIFGDMVAIVEDITERQARGQSLSTKDLNLGNYEVVYDNGWMFEYEGYERIKNKKGCGLALS